MTHILPISLPIKRMCDRGKIKPFIAGAIVVLFSLVTIFAPRADVSATGVSSVRGLAAMKEVTRQSIPYNLALETDRPKLLEFYANWCTTCQSMAPAIRDLHQKYHHSIDFVAIDIDDPQWMSTLKKYGVTGVPHFTILDRNNHIVRTDIGRVPQSVFDRALEALSS